MPTTTDPVTPRADDLPRRVGRYTLQALLGEGGAARVYRATLHGPAGFRKRLAVKVLAKGAVGNLPEEARLGALLEHPNLVEVYDLSLADGRYLIAMEWVRGPSLHRLLAERGPLPGRAVLQLAAQLCNALAHAHALSTDGPPHPIVHRDLKPANVLLTRHGQVKLADLGIAALAGSTLEQTIGTPAYMAPEQAHGEPVDPRTDQFSLGLVLLEAATGVRQLSGRSLAEVAAKHVRLQQRLRRGLLQSAADAVVPGLGPVLGRCLATAPDARFADCGAVSDALAGLAGSGPGLAEWLAAGTEASGPSSRVAAPTPSASSDAPTQVQARTNLPSVDAPLFGREADLAALHGHLERGRLVTVHGPGGMGKTTLVRRFGAEVAPSWPGGVWFCDLSDVREVSGLCSAVSAALGLPLGEGTADAVRRQVGRQLGSRGRVLVILDNLEQVVAPAAEALAGWLVQAPDARFLGTSRTVLRLPDERILALGPLEVAEGVALLRARAALRGPGAAPWAEASSDVALRELVTALDGLPLALELAAARAALMTPAEVRSRLSQRFRVLASGPRTAPARQATLRGVLDASWDLLTDPQRSTLAQLSVFHGGFTLDAAEGVVQLDDPDAGWVLDRVSELHDHALIASRRGLDGQPRFSLYASVRAYAEERVVDPAGLAARHSRWFSRFGQPEVLRAQRADVGLAGLACELENLEHAVGTTVAARDGLHAARCARAAGEVYLARGPFAPGLRVAQAALDVAPDDVSLLVVAAKLAGRLALPEATAWAERAVAAAGTPRETARSLLQLAMAYKQRGRATAALELEERARIAAEHLGDPQLLGSVHLGLGITLREIGRARDAHAWMVRAVADACRAEDRRLLGRALVSLGELEVALGHLEQGRATLRRALHEASDAPTVKAHALGNLGILCRQQGDHAGARQHYRAALTGYRAMGHRRDEGIVTCNLGVVAILGDRLEEAEACFVEAGRIGEEIDDPRLKGNAALNVSDVYHRRGQATATRQALAEARADYARVPARVPVALIDLICAGLDLAAGDVASATPLAEAGLAEARETGARRYEALGWARHAELARRAGDGALARRHADEALSVARSIGDPQIVGYALVERARVADADGDRALAASHVADALEAYARAHDRRGGAEARLVLAWGHLAAGEPERTIEEADAVIAGGAGSSAVAVAEARGLIARARRMLGEEPDAEALDAACDDLVRFGYATVADRLRSP